MTILKVLTEKLRFKRYSERTIETYISYVRKFLNDENVYDPYQVRLSQIKNYLEHRTYTSQSQQNQMIGALKVFAKYILGKTDLSLSKIERPRKEKKLPKVIDGVVLKEKINAIKNLKHRAILATGFSCGLRVSEVINMKLKDIDRHRMIIHIRNAKGRKDRFVKLSKNLLALLEDYYKRFKPVDYVFNGQFDIKYTATSCNKLMKKYIGADTHFHLLRHSFATMLHEKGVDIATISRILGHNSIKTTMIYTQVSNQTLQDTPAVF